MRFRVLLLCGWLTLLSLAGCQSKTAAKETLPLADLPAGLLQVAEKTLPDVKFDSARKMQKGGEDVYEIRGKQPNGKVREVEVNALGKVVEVE